MRHITNKIRQLCSANKLVACSSNSFEHSFFVHNVQNRKCAGKSISSRRWFSDRLPVTNATNGRSKNELSKNHLLKPELKKPNVHTDLEEEDEDDIFDGEEEPYSLGREQEVMNILLYDGCGDVKYSQWGGAFLKEFPSIKTDSPTDHQRIEDVSHLACSNCERMGHTEEQCSAPEATQLGKKDSKVGRVKEAVITKRQQQSSSFTANQPSFGDIRKVYLRNVSFKHEGNRPLPTQAEARKVGGMKSGERAHTSLRSEFGKDSHEQNQYESTSRQFAFPDISYQTDRRHRSSQDRSQENSEKRTHSSKATNNVQSRNSEKRGGMNPKAQDSSNGPNTSDPAEKNRKTFAPNQNLRPKTRMDENKSGPNSCYNCGSAGHFAKSCFAPKKSMGHTNKKISRSKSMEK